jgi:phosphatidylglycerol:prolipoprotein diacylglycerol transferase
MFPRIGAVPTYSIFYAISIIIYFIICKKTAHRWGLRNRVYITASLCYIVGMVFVAKILYDIHHSQFNFQQLFSLRHYLGGGLWAGQLAYLGLGVPLVLLVSKSRAAAIDLLAWSIAIPLSITKIGCFFNGCCYGRECSLPWAITFPEGAAAPAVVPLHPTQIYEIILLVCIWLFLKGLKIERWRGTMLLWFLCLYGFGRMGIDFFRGDTDRYIYVGPITLTQLFCLIAALVSIFILLLQNKLLKHK